MTGSRGAGQALDSTHTSWENQAWWFGGQRRGSATSEHCWAEKDLRGLTQDRGLRGPGRPSAGHQRSMRPAGSANLVVHVGGGAGGKRATHVDPPSPRGASLDRAWELPGSPTRGIRPGETVIS